MPGKGRVRFAGSLPAVQEGMSRLRATVTAVHEPGEIERAMDVIYEAGKRMGMVK